MKTNSSEVQKRTQNLVTLAFSEAQRTYAAHERALKHLEKAFLLDTTAFLNSFVYALNRVLAIFSREAAVERLVSFIARFASTYSTSSLEDDSSIEESENFCSVLLAYLLERADCNEKSVRFRVCHIIGATLKSLPENAEINDEIWEQLLRTMLQRARDKVPRVRATAAASICRLQNTGSAVDDDATKCLVDMLSKDRSASVRKAALQAVAVTDSTLPFILRRVKDISEDVRKVALSTLAAKVNPLQLPKENLIELLDQGLKDRASSVRKICAEELLIKGWFEGACRSNIFDLAELLDCSENEKKVLSVLKVILSSPKGSRILDSIIIDPNNLTSEDVIVLRAISEVDGGDMKLEEIIKSNIEYAHILEFYSTNEYACRNLLSLCKSIDMSDEAGRKVLEEKLRIEFLANKEVQHSAIPDAVSALREVSFSEEEWARTARDVVLNDVTTSDDDLSCDGWANDRAFVIGEALLQGARMQPSDNLVNPVYHWVVERLVLPRVLSPDKERRKSALGCLGLYCLLDMSGVKASQHIPLYIQACKSDTIEIQILAAKCLVDFALVLKNIGQDEPNEDTSDLEVIPRGHFDQEETVLKELVALLELYLGEEEATDARCCGAESLAKLIFARRLTPTPVLLSKLIILLHDPSTEDDVRLRQCLSVFFPAYAFAHSDNRSLLEQALLPTCRMLLDIDGDIATEEIPKLKVAQYVISLLQSSHAIQTTTPNQEGTSKGETNCLDVTLLSQVAKSTLQELATTEECTTEACRLYSGILGLIPVECATTAGDHAEELFKLCNLALDSISDTRSFSAVRRWRNKAEAKSQNHIRDEVANPAEVDTTTDARSEVSMENQGLEPSEDA